MGWAKQRRPLPLILSSQASCVIVSGFRAALELDTYHLSNFIRPRCAERAIIMHIGFFACFHAISHERKSFQQNRHILFLALVALKLLVSLISCLVACSARIVVERQTLTDQPFWSPGRPALRAKVTGRIGIESA